MKNKLITLIQKLIPAYIEVRSLYWMNYAEKMDENLSDIFYNIDIENYTRARILIDEFNKTYNQGSVPEWVAIQMSEINKAESMLNFLNQN